MSTRDLPRALGFYRDLLGATVAYQFPPDGEPVYVGLDLGRSHVGLGAKPDAPEGEQRFALWVYVGDCDVAVTTLRAAGVPVVVEPADQPWGERMATVTDPDGNQVIVASLKR